MYSNNVFFLFMIWRPSQVKSLGQYTLFVLPYFGFSAYHTETSNWIIGFNRLLGQNTFRLRPIHQKRYIRISPCVLVSSYVWIILFVFGTHILRRSFLFTVIDFLPSFRVVDRTRTCYGRSNYHSVIASSYSISSDYLWILSLLPSHYVFVVRSLWFVKNNETRTMGFCTTPTSRTLG